MKNCLKNRAPRGNESRSRSVIPESIHPNLLTFLRDKKATDTEIEVFFCIALLQKAGQTVQNLDVQSGCNMHRSTVKFNIRNMIEKKIIKRKGYSYIAVIPDFIKKIQKA